MCTTPGSIYTPAIITHHAVHVGETPQRAAFVLDTVLRAHDRHGGTGQRRQRLERVRGVLTFHREHDDVVRAECDLRRMLDDRNAQRAPAAGSSEAQPVRRDRAAVLAARDQQYVAAGFEQERAERSTDRARAVEDVSHGDEPWRRPTGNPSGAAPKSGLMARTIPKENTADWNLNGLLAIAFGHGVNDFFSGTVALDDLLRRLERRVVGLVPRRRRLSSGT